MVVVLVLMSRLKHEILLITANFIDVMIIDTDTISFLLGLYPNLQRNLLIAGGLALPLMVWFWRTDPYRIRMRIAAAGAGSCLAGVTALCFINPIHNYEAFFGDSYVSKFVRSGVGAVSELMTHGLLESDPVATARSGPRRRAAATRRPSARTSSWCSTSRASTSPRCRACACRTATATTSPRSTASSAPSWSRAPAGPPGTPSTTC